MFHLFAQIGQALVGEIMKRAIAAGIDWGKRRKRPAAEEVKQKVEELVADAAQTVVPPNTMPAEDRRQLVAGIAEITLPTFQQVVEYSPNTQRIMHAVKKSASKVATKKAAKKTAAKKAVTKSWARKKAVTKRPTHTKATRKAKRV